MQSAFCKDFVDFIGCISQEKVEYLIVGAHAMARHGYVRATGDIDFWINPTAENSARLLKALKCFGGPTFGIDSGYFAVLGNALQLGVPPLRIDLLTLIEGLNFANSFKNARWEVLESFQIPFLSLEDLVVNKSTNPRDKDKIDCAELLKILSKGAKK